MVFLHHYVFKYMCFFSVGVFLKNVCKVRVQRSSCCMEETTPARGWQWPHMFASETVSFVDYHYWLWLLFFLPLLLKLEHSTKFTLTLLCYVRSCPECATTNYIHSFDLQNHWGYRNKTNPSIKFQLPAPPESCSLFNAYICSYL